MIRRTFIYLLAVLLLSASAGCGSKPVSGGKVLATINSRPITTDELNSKIAKMPQYMRNMVQKNKKRYLDDMVVEKIFYEEAVRKGFDRDKELKEMINEARRRIIIAKFVEKEVDEKAAVTEEEMKVFYEDNKEKFLSPAMWRASHILVANQREAEDILAELSKGANFEELAKSHSIDATSSRGGDIGFFKKGQLVPEFETACLKLEVGQMSGIVRTQFGFHIIKMTDKREPAVESFDKVKKAIEGELIRGKRTELFNKVVEKLKARYKVKVAEDAFKTLEESSK